MTADKHSLTEEATMNDSSCSRIWTIIKEVLDLASKVALPVVVAVVGGSYTASVKESENHVRYVELAIEQLRTTPTPENSALREWAIEVLKLHSPIALSNEAISQLRAHPIAISVTASGAALTSGTATISGGAAQSQ